MTNNNPDSFDRDCTQLGEIFLKIEGGKYHIASPIYDHEYVDEIVVKAFEVANEDNTARYRIVFDIEEIFEGEEFFDD